MKAQASVEMLIILAGLLLVLGIVLAASGGRLADTRMYADAEVVRAGLANIADAADEVYGQGVGSERRVTLRLPGSVVQGRSFVDGHLVGVALDTGKGITDINAKAEAPLQGTLPDAPGEYLVRVRAGEGFVVIGDTSLLIEPSLVYAYMGMRETATRKITITNIGSSELAVRLVLIWQASAVNVNLGMSNLLIPASESRTVPITFQSGRTAGTYAGKITLDASNGEHFEIEVIADVR